LFNSAEKYKKKAKILLKKGAVESNLDYKYSTVFL